MLTITGYPPRHSTLRETAEEIRKRRVRHVNDETSNLVEYTRIGTDWVSGAMQGVELLNVGRESTGLKNLFLWDCYLY